MKNQALLCTTKHNTFKMLLMLCAFIMLSWQGMAQFKAPSVFPAIPIAVFPTPSSSSIFLDNLNTKYLSNYSVDITSFGTSFGVGIDVAAWSYDQSLGGGGMIAAGNHNLSPASSVLNGVATTTATIDLPNAVDIRVGYMEPYIVAAYFDVLLGRYVFAWFDWAAPSGSTITQALGSPILLPTLATPPLSNYGRISMDINQDGNKVAMVYDDGGYIYGAGIELIGATFNFMLPTTPYALSSLTSGAPSSGNINPDISFNREPGTGVDYIFLTYYNTILGGELVWKYPFTQLYGKLGGLMTYLDGIVLPSGVSYVNFDCPDHFSFNHWAYTYTDGNNIYLRADTANGGSPSVYTTIINDGTLSNMPYDISSFSNVVPTLTYKHNLGRDEIFVAWASDAVGTYLSPYTETYVSATVAVNGPSAPLGVTNPEYAIIDNNPNAHYMLSTPLIALSRNARNANRFVSYTTDEPTLGFELKHKNVDFFNDYYRRSDPTVTNAITNNVLKLYPNPFASEINLDVPYELQKETWSISISDLLGRQIESYNGASPNIFVHDASSKLSSGQYIIKLQCTNSEPQIIKITKQ